MKERSIFTIIMLVNIRSITLVVVVLLGSSSAEDPMAQYSSMVADMWVDGAEIIRILWRECSKKLIDVKDVIDHKEYFPKFVRCMKRKTLRALDRSLSTDIVPLTQGISLVRFEMVDHSGNVMTNENETSSWTEKELEQVEWRNLALQRLAKVLRTHVIKFDFDGDARKLETAEYRGRRRHQMMTMMMFGIVSIGMVLIPMGFQFLAVLGGKALLLAKMALILASIQGLKKVDAWDGFQGVPKIATSPVSYGFYHSYPPPPAPAPPFEHFEKRSQEDWFSDLINTATSRPMQQYQPWMNKLHTSILKSDRISKGEADTNKLKREPSKTSEARLYPVYTPESNFITSIDDPPSVLDLTTRPGQVEADFTVDLPYNGIRFQGPTAVVSS